MKHTLIPEHQTETMSVTNLCVTELGDLIHIQISRNELFQNQNELALNVIIDPKELHSFIGTLLHVQAKMKGK